MSTTAHQFTDTPQLHERRLNPRILPKSLIYVACGESNGGMVLNAGDDGLAISMAIPVGDAAYSNLDVRLNGLPQSIEVHGRMVWTTKSKKRAGVHLLDLTNAQRELIRQWLALDAVRDVNLTPRVVGKVSSPPTVAVSVPAGAAPAPHESAVVAPEIAAPAITASEVAASAVTAAAPSSNLANTPAIASEPAVVAPQNTDAERVKPPSISNRSLSSEQRSTLLDGFGGTAPETLGPPLAEQLSFDRSALHTPSSSASSGPTPAAFRENEWDLASVTMVPRKRVRPEGLSALALVLLWIAIPSLGIGILVGRRPLQHWLAQRNAATDPVSRETQSDVEAPKIVPSQPATSTHDLDSGTPRVPQTVSVETVEPPTLNRTVFKPANGYALGNSSSPAVDTRLLNSMSTQEARAYRNSKTAIAAANAAPPATLTLPPGRPSPSTILSNASAVTDAKTLPPAVSTTKAAPPASIGNNTTPSPSIAANTSGSSNNSFFPASNKGGAEVVATSGAAKSSSSISNASNSSAPVAAPGNSNASASTGSSIVKPNSAPVFAASNSAPVSATPSASATPKPTLAPPPNAATPKPTLASPSNVASSVASNSLPAIASASPARSISPSSSPTIASGVAPIASANIAPVSTQPPLHGVMMVARKSNEPFLLKLPAESVAVGRSTSVRMQRFVMVPAESRWHHHGQIAKLSVGQLLKQTAPEKNDGVQTRAGDVVTVRAFVDKQGTVEDLKPISGRFALMPRVMRSVRDWQFDQTLIDDKPVEAEVDITVEFRASP